MIKLSADVLVFSKDHRYSMPTTIYVERPTKTEALEAFNAIKGDMYVEKISYSYVEKVDRGSKRCYN